MIRRLLVASIAIAGPLCASGQQWHADVDAGRIRSALDPSSSATESIVAGIGYEDATTGFRISTGIPTQTMARYWGSVAGFKRLAVNRSGLVAGVDLSGNGYLFQDRKTATSGGGLFEPFSQTQTTVTGHAMAGQALPLIGFESGPVQLQARAGVSYYSVSIESQQRDRTVKLGDIQATFQPSSSFALVPVVRVFQPLKEKTSTFAGISGVVAQGPLNLWASAGQWLTDVDSASSAKTAWGAGGSLRFASRLKLTGSVRRDGFDPLYLNAPQTSWGAGLSMLFGATPRVPSAPVPAAYHGGVATIRLPLSSSADTPSIAGDFNRWTPSPMQRDGKYWSYSVSTAPGVYNYSFVSADGKWFVPESVPGRKDDGMGGQVAVLVVR